MAGVIKNMQILVVTEPYSESGELNYALRSAKAVCGLLLSDISVNIVIAINLLNWLS